MSGKRHDKPLKGTVRIGKLRDALDSIDSGHYSQYLDQIKGLSDDEKVEIELTPGNENGDAKLIVNTKRQASPAPAAM